jgi:hypothetical protein
MSPAAARTRSRVDVFVRAAIGIQAPYRFGRTRIHVHLTLGDRPQRVREPRDDEPRSVRRPAQDVVDDAGGAHRLEDDGGRGGVER